MKTRGFTIFLATLIASLSLAIGLAVYDLTVREIRLSETTEQSELAIYAADTGAECALFWDAKFNDADYSAFATSSDYVGGVAVSGQALCNAQDISALWTISISPPPVPPRSYATTTFQFLAGATANGPCVMVEVGKSNSGNGIINTLIVSHGYNTCAAGAPLRLERTLQVRY